MSRDYSLLNPVLGGRRSIVMAAARGAGLQRQVVNVAGVWHSAGGGGKAGGAGCCWVKSSVQAWVGLAGDKRVRKSGGWG